MSRKLLWMVRLMTVLLAAACGWPFGAARAADQTTVRPEPVIQDDADLLTEAEEEALRADMLPLCDYGTPLFWTTVEAGDYTSLAERFYHRRLGYGESGVLFVINMRARQLTVFSDGAMYRVITRGEAQTITDNVYRMAGREQYYDCASSAFGQMLNLMRGEEIARPMKQVSNLLLAMTLALLAVYLYLAHRYENRPKTGVVKAALPVTATAAAAFAATTVHHQTRLAKRQRTKITSDSGGHGGGGGGGGHGGGGGGSSGGGGSHGF